MDNNSCKTCVYCRQHYTFDHRKIFGVHCGHCTYQRAKTKRPDAKACENYLLSESAKNAFVAKEYLSKALLEYMLRLELLPEIYDIKKEWDTLRILFQLDEQRICKANSISASDAF